MKNELEQYPLLAGFLGVEDSNVDESMLSILVRDIKDSYIGLGVCVSSECANADAPQLVQQAMNVMANVYDSLKSILREQESMQ